MTIVKIYGGLGNQMFQYAFYLALSSSRKHVIYDASLVVSEMCKMQRCTIFDAFTLTGEEQETVIRNGKMADRFPQLNMLRYRFLRKTQGWQVDTQCGTFLSDVLVPNKGYYEGYWQSEKYFENCKQQVRAAFRPKNDLPEQSPKYLSMIQQEPAPISLHVRLGDYASPENQRVFGNICTVDYYQKAMREMICRYPHARFYVFSNDIEKAKTFLKDYACVFVEGNDEMHGWADMYLMSQCKHHIIANSSFSWWGAWLNEKPDKIVIAPKKWLNTNETPDICPDDWIRI